jgi:hypothetical protein
MFITDPGSEFFPSWILDPGSDFFHPGSRIRIKEFKYFSPKNGSKLSEILSGLFILDPDPDFYPSRILDPGVKNALHT